jgi:glycosyltransferase involved in cell wall biosynthesis
MQPGTTTRHEPAQPQDDIALSIVVPAYNERHSIGRTLEELRAFLATWPGGYEIIVVADGDDGTREWLREQASDAQPLTVLGQAGRGGKGRGVRLGVAHARGRLIGFVDADGKTPIEELTRLLPFFEQGYDIVIGSRGVAGACIERAQPWHRRLGSRAFGLFMHTVVGLRELRDTQCGFKFFRGAVAHELFARQRIDGYMFDVEVLHLASRAGHRVREVGVRWRDDGDSRLELLRGNWRNFLDVLSIRFARR